MDNRPLDNIGNNDCQPVGSDAGFIEFLFHGERSSEQTDGGYPALGKVDRGRKDLGGM